MELYKFFYIMWFF